MCFLKYRASAGGISLHVLPPFTVKVLEVDSQSKELAEVLPALRCSMLTPFPWSGSDGWWQPAQLCSDLAASLRYVCEGLLLTLVREGQRV